MQGGAKKVMLLCPTYISSSHGIERERDRAH